MDEICCNIGILEQEKRLRDEIMKGYERIGCNKCDGYNPKCKHYIPLYVEKKDNGTI